ncbi:hypothetical protein [Paracidovorax avenae]|uniref:hypothetical protein n=1 Tax=Paracidovorax avenae TaxID=80867 RepID=UPI0012603575|nr:hypothetical protein [Paracidovorax avenae]
MDAATWDFGLHLVTAATVAGALGGIGALLVLSFLRDAAAYTGLIDRIPQGPEETPDRGMGQRPMVDLSRATYPTPSCEECPARRGGYASDASATGGDAGRWDKHGAGPRPASPAQPQSHSRLKNTVPQALPPGVLGAGGDDSGGKQGFPPELAPHPLPATALPVARLPITPWTAAGESAGKHGFPEDFADTVPARH